jgi:hypothetical protein
MKKNDRKIIVDGLFKRLDYCEELSKNAATEMCVKLNYGEAAVFLEKQAKELEKAAHDCRLLDNTKP